MAPDRPALTIVLTLKDRSAFTYRWMRYMNDARCPYPILIADGGTDGAVEARLRDAANYPALRYTYLRYPVDSDYTVFYRKFHDVVAQVTTPYVLLADNDDFFFLEHIPSFLDYLDRHDDFVSCGGTPVALRLLAAGNAVLGEPSAKRYAAIPDRRPKPVVAASGIDRVCYFMTHTHRQYLWSSWYHVHRTPALQRALEVVTRHTFADPVSLEMHLHVWLLLTGSYQALDVPFLVTQQGASQLTAAIDARGNLVERFVMSNAFADLHYSVESFVPAVALADRERIYKAMAGFFADTAIKLYAPQLVQGSRPPVAAPAMRLPRLEPYILG